LSRHTPLTSIGLSWCKSQLHKLSAAIRCFQSHIVVQVTAPQARCCDPVFPESYRGASHSSTSSVLRSGVSRIISCCKSQLHKLGAAIRCFQNHIVVQVTAPQARCCDPVFPESLWKRCRPTREPIPDSAAVFFPPHGYRSCECGRLPPRHRSRR